MMAMDMDREVLADQQPVAAEVRFMDEVNSERGFPGSYETRLAKLEGRGGSEKEGAIKGLEAPAGWQPGASEKNGLGPRSLETFHPPGEPDVTMSVFNRGMPVSDASAAAFREILARKPAHAGAQALTPDEIRSLREIMGQNNAGDNQYTNGQPDLYPPVFDLKNAQTARINGRTVLAVRGAFVDVNDGKPAGQHNPVKEFVGIFIAGDGSGKSIDEVMLEGPPGRLTPARMSEFEQSLKSIEW